MATRLSTDLEAAMLRLSKAAPQAGLQDSPLTLMQDGGERAAREREAPEVLVPPRAALFWMHSPCRKCSLA